MIGACRHGPGSQRWQASGSRENHWCRRDAGDDHEVVALDISALPDEARALIAAQAATIARQQMQLNESQKLITRLQTQLAKLRRMQFGRSSERLNTEIAQLELALEELEEHDATRSGEAVTVAAAGALDVLKPVRRPLPDHLPRETVMHPTVCTCPRCGGALRRLGEDVTEVLDYRPASFRVIRHVRPKFTCRVCETITQAPAPSLPIRRGRASAALLRTCWCPSTATTCPYIGRARSTVEISAERDLQSSRYRVGALHPRRLGRSDLCAVAPFGRCTGAACRARRSSLCG